MQLFTPQNLVGLSLLIACQIPIIILWALVFDPKRRPAWERTQCGDYDINFGIAIWEPLYLAFFWASVLTFFIACYTLYMHPNTWDVIASDPSLLLLSPVAMVVAGAPFGLATALLFPYNPRAPLSETPIQTATINPIERPTLIRGQQDEL